MAIGQKTEFYADDGLVPFTAGSAVTSGVPQVVAGRIAVPLADVDASGVDELKTEGRFRARKPTGAWVAGDRIWWNATGDPINGTAGTGCYTNVATSATAGFPCVGTAEAAAASGDEFGYVQLNVFKQPINYSNVAASTAVTASSTETLFDKSFSIPAGTLKVGDVIDIAFQGIATATNSTDTLAVKLYIGGLTGTALLTGTATDVANNAIFAGTFKAVVRTIGASGTLVGFGMHTDVPAASGTATGAVTEIVASTTIDTTAAQVVGVSATWSTTNAGNSCRLDLLNVMISGQNMA